MGEHVFQCSAQDFISAERLTKQNGTAYQHRPIPSPTLRSRGDGKDVWHGQQSSFGVSGDECKGVNIRGFSDEGPAWGDMESQCLAVNLGGHDGQRHAAGDVTDVVIRHASGLSGQVNVSELQEGFYGLRLRDETTFDNQHNATSNVMQGATHGGGRGQPSRGMAWEIESRRSAQSQPTSVDLFDMCEFACDFDPRRGVDTKTPISPSEDPRRVVCLYTHTYNFAFWFLLFVFVRFRFGVFFLV